MRILLLAVGLVCSSLIWAQKAYTVSDVPNPLRQSNSWIFDPGQRMDGASYQRVNALLEKLNRQTDAQGAVAFLPSIGDDIPKDFAVALFEQWGVGNAGSDFGFLLLVVEDQRRSELEIGYGLEAIVTDAYAKRILVNAFLPQMRAGNPGKAVQYTIEAVDFLIRGSNQIDSTAVASVEYEEAQNRFEQLFGSQRRTGIEEFTPFDSPARNRGSWLNSFLGSPAGTVYLLLHLAFHLGLGIWIGNVYFSKETLHDKWRKVNYVTLWPFILIFPFPYGIIFYPLQRYFLRRLRYMPRYSDKDGSKMRLLSDDEEDEYLEHGQEVEEEVGSIEHDVWLSATGQDMLILPYKRIWTFYKACPQCGYKTYKQSKSRVLKAATTSSTGTREVTLTCKACNYQVKELRIIPKKSSSSSSGSFGGSSGGSSFGGGSSGGGGAGASW